ncbi:sugar kinases, ribokinase family [Zymobacter palmae]|uniref:Sugar kinases, ribokinase family n=1 Tax=Zymobacter palmae TaxID=33074 RepID=A0A348HDN8_9GAMM|nr:sugar kinases, ribokinase family [Zymobacter palmae]
MSIFLIVCTRIIFKRCNRCIEQGVIGLTTNNRYTAFVQLNANHTVDDALRFVDGGLQHVAFRRPPVTVVHDFRVLRHQTILQVSRFAVQRDGFDSAVRFQHDGAPWGFVAPTGFHAYIAVLDDIQTTDTVFATQTVQFGQQLVRCQFLAIQRNRITVAVGDFEVGRSIRSLLGADTPTPHVIFRFGPRVFQHAALIGDVQQVGIHRVRGFFLVLSVVYWDVVLFTVGHQFFTGVEIPFTPRRDDLDTRFERISAQLETHLVVTFTGSTVCDGIGTGFIGDFNQSSSDERTCDGSTQQVLTFIDGVGTEHREYIVTHEGFAQIFNVDFLDAQLTCLFSCRFDFFTLTQIGRERHDFTVVGFLKPFGDHGSIQPTRVGQHHLLHVGHAHLLLFVLIVVQPAYAIGGYLRTMHMKLLIPQYIVMYDLSYTTEDESRPI